MAPNFRKIKAFGGHKRGAAPPGYIDTAIEEASDHDLEAGSFLTENTRNNTVENNSQGDNPYLDEYRA